MRLPPVSIYSGRLARWLTGAGRVGAITLGRRIFVAPGFVKRDEDGRRTIPGWLLAHEAAHVLQYERAGMFRFLSAYLRGYVRALRELGRWDAGARLAAYLSLAEEREARTAEAAYRAWQTAESVTVTAGDTDGLRRHGLTR